MTRHPARLALLPVLALLLLAEPGAAHPPYGMAADARGHVYFSDLETVWRLSPEGRLTVFRPHVPDTHVHALALAPDGEIEGDQNHYDPATKRFYSGLWRRTPDGAEQAIVPMTERPPEGAGVWRDKAGNRYTSQWRSRDDRRMVLLRRRPDGRVDVPFDEAGGGSRPNQVTVESIGGMAFGADGSLFFTNGAVLRRLAPDGTVSVTYDGGKGSSLRGIAVAPDGRVLAADMGAKAVLAVGADGKAETLYRETAAWLPNAVALAAGRLLVLEANADAYQYENRVRVVEVKDSRGRVVAVPGQVPPARAQLRVARETRWAPGMAVGAAVLLVLGLALVRYRRLRGKRPRD